MNSSRRTISSLWKGLCLGTTGAADLSYNSAGAQVLAGIAPSHRAGRQDDNVEPLFRKPLPGGQLDTFRFLLEWLRDPIGTAAVAPSGKALASLITQHIDEWTGPVLELGPGTGVFTQGLIARGVAERDLTLVERNQTFASMLRQRYPRATVLSIDASELPPVEGNGSREFGAAVCGLGLRSMDIRQVEAIMRATFRRMKPGAALYLFTYGLRCSVPDDVLDRLGLVAQRVGTALRNVPPASVYRIFVSQRSTDAPAPACPNGAQPFDHAGASAGPVGASATAGIVRSPAPALGSSRPVRDEPFLHEASGRQMEPAENQEK